MTMPATEVSVANQVVRFSSSYKDLQAVQDRRTFAVRFTRWMQLTIQKRLISRILLSEQRQKPPRLFKLFSPFPYLRRIPARLVGIGIRPEQVRTPDIATAA
jgi:hypothetical protein